MRLVRLTLGTAGWFPGPGTDLMSDDDGWEYSTEGDLDPDLTEEAGYAYWDPPRHRAWGPVVMKFGLWIVLVSFLGSILMAFLR